MAISLNNNDVTYRVPGGRARAAAWLRGVVRREGKACGDIAIVFCSDAALLEMNHRFLGHDYFTDVITFDYTAGEVVGGDIYISVETVASNAAVFGTTPAREMLRVMVHGVLHLCGYKDKTAAEQKTMRAKEDGYLELYDKTGASLIPARQDANSSTPKNSLQQ
ncbi:MAG: rRNA maturation RNase YbeY [Rikenellaceae bacterium]|nr:rRNA maturation RNase YbeY [Rikenellaceae bacterium]